MPKLDYRATSTFLASMLNLQPASVQCAYDLSVVNFQDAEISMIRRAVQSLPFSSRTSLFSGRGFWGSAEELG
jgi:hypothetical protein